MNYFLFAFLLENHSLYALFKLHWLALLLVVSYFYIKKIVRSTFYKVTRNQKTYFYTATFLLFIIKATPLDVIGTYYLFSAHIFQLSLIYFVIIPLFLLSLPVSLLRQLVWNHRTKFILNMLSHPWLSLITFNGLLTIYLIPSVFNFFHGTMILEDIFLFFLLVNAIFMWWIIIHPLPELRGLSYFMRAAYIFFASLALIPIGFFFVIVQHAHFPFYVATEGELVSVLTSIYDQQLAGGILKITQMTSYAFALLMIVLKWGKQEEAKEGTVEEENIRYVRGVVIHLDKEKK